MINLTHSNKVTLIALIVLELDKRIEHYNRFHDRLSDHDKMLQIDNINDVQRIYDKFKNEIPDEKTE